MAVTINASTSAGLISSADTSGILQLQTANTTALTVDASQNVGIGTASPARKLTVLGSGNFTDGTNDITLYNDGSVGTNGSLNLKLVTGGTTKATLDTSGNLGLGVTPSAWNSGFKVLEINNAIYAGFSDTRAQILSNAYVDTGGTARYKTTGAATSYATNTGGGGTHAWFTAASGTAGNAITFTQAMTLGSTGNWSLGTTVNSAPAQIWKANASTGMTLSNVSTTMNVLDNTTPSAIGVGGRILFGATYFTGGGTMGTGYIGTFKENAPDNSGSEYNHSLTFGVSNGSLGIFEAGRINSNGRFMLGATSIPGSFASTRMYVAQATTVADYSAVFDSTTGTGSNCYGPLVKYTAASPNGTGNEFLLCADSTATRATFRSNGGLANYSANNVNLSDRREKTNFALAGSYLDKICAIPVQTFNYIDQNLEEDGGLTLGVVAQDVQAVAPELVMESNWASKDETHKMRLSIYQTDLQYALMKCIQEQQALITQLQADVATLKGN